MNRWVLKVDNLFRCELGASLTEFALAVPVFLTAVFSFFEFGRYYLAINAAESAARAAMNQARVNPEFDNETAENGGTPPYQAVQTELLAMPVTFLENWYGGAGRLGKTLSNVSVAINYPPNGSETPLREYFQSTPIEVSVTARYEPIFPLIPPITIKQTSFGFREPRFASTLPAMVDCTGKRITSTTFATGALCPCDGDPLRYIQGEAWAQEEGESSPSPPPSVECLCRPPMVEDGNGECKCPVPGTEYVATGQVNWNGVPGGDCVCQNTCGPFQKQVIENGTCSCECVDGAVPDGYNSCACSPNHEATPLGMSCQCRSCKQGTVAPWIYDNPTSIEDNCECECKVYTNLDNWAYDAQNRVCSCELQPSDCTDPAFPLYRNEPSWGLCGCYACSGQHLDPSDMGYSTANPGATQCDCPNFQQLVDFCTAQGKASYRHYGGCGGCYDCPANKQLAATPGSDGTYGCVCIIEPSEANCPAPKEWNESLCTCSCPIVNCQAPKIMNVSECGCSCPVVNCNSQIMGSQLNNANCQCECPGGTAPVPVPGGGLECDGYSGGG